MKGSLKVLLFTLLSLSCSGFALAQTCSPVTQCEVISNSGGNYCVPANTTLTSRGGDCLVIAARPT
jgi:hypothetical protein